MLALTHKLLSGSGDQLIAEIIRKALDPKDKDQAMMLKLCADRMAPISAFEKAQDGPRGTIELRVTVASPAQSGESGRAEKRAGQTLAALPQHGDMTDVIDVVATEIASGLEPTV